MSDIDGMSNFEPTLLALARDDVEPTAARRGRRLPSRLTIGLGLAGLFALATVLSGILQPRDPLAQTLTDRLKGPSTDYLLGTDQLGRDILSRLLAGLAWSLGVSAISTVCALVIGGLVGMLAGWRGGWVRTVLVRAIDIAISFPTLVLVVTVMAVLGRGFVSLVATLSIASWPLFARVVYAETMGLREREYVLAARLLGVRSRRALLVHVVPGLRPTLLVMAAFTFADMLIAESALSFLGIGAPLAEPTWGNMLSESRLYLVDAPWMMIAPAGMIVLAVVTANLIGDGLAAHARGRERSIG